MRVFDEKSRSAFGLKNANYMNFNDSFNRVHHIL